MATQGVLLGCGNPLLDISAHVPLEFLDKYEVKLNNAILAEDKHKPMYDDLVKDFEVDYIAGGATQNTIRVAQWMMQVEGATSYTGCVGKDKYGAQLKKSATADGVRTLYLEDEKEPTGTCAVLVNEAERSLIANLGAANHMKEAHLDSQELKAVIEKAKFFYIAGFFLTVSPPSILKIGDHSLKNGKTFCMNLSAPFLCQFFKDPMMAAMPYVDYLFGNESEAVAFGAAQGFKATDVEGIAKEAAALEYKGKGSRTVVFTQGANQTIVIKDGKLTTYAVPKIPKDEMVDVNGAGDAFVGGFLAKLIAGKDLDECVQTGHYCAGYIIRRSGCVLEGKPNYTYTH